MTLPPVIRIFFALDLPNNIKKQLGRYISNLKKHAKSQAIRWTKPDNLHITLQFLPEVKSEDVVAILQSVKHRLENVSTSAQLSCGEIQVFPNPYRPRVIVLDIIPQDGPATLSSLIGEGIKAGGYPIETRPFRAHLTLGRIKQPHVIDLSFLSEIAKPECDPFSLNEVILFRSEPQPEGSMYQVMEKVALPQAVG